MKLCNEIPLKWKIAGMCRRHRRYRKSKNSSFMQNIQYAYDHASDASDAYLQSD